MLRRRLRLGYFIAPKTACTNVITDDLTIDGDPFFLEVDTPAPLAPSMGVAQLKADFRPPVTNNTKSRHKKKPPNNISRGNILTDSGLESNKKILPHC